MNVDVNCKFSDLAFFSCLCNNCCHARSAVFVNVVRPTAIVITVVLFCSLGGSSSAIRVFIIGCAGTSRIVVAGIVIAKIVVAGRSIAVRLTGVRNCIMRVKNLITHILNLKENRNKI